MDRQVTHALESIFCKEHLDKFKTIKRFTQGVSTRGNWAGASIWLRRSPSTRRVRSCRRVPLRSRAMRWAPRPLWSIRFEPLHADGLSGYPGSIHARRLGGRLDLAMWWTVDWAEAIVPSWAIATARQRDGRSGRYGGFALNRRMRMASVGTRAVSAARLPLPAWCSRRIWAATATDTIGGVVSLY